jgi:hypothetical protein
MSEREEYDELECDDKLFTCSCGETGKFSEMFNDECLDEGCGGMGILHCECGGDSLCVCHNHGEIECEGCDDCEDDDYDWRDGEMDDDYYYGDDE